MNIVEISKKFPTQEAAVSHFEKVRWANGNVKCPNCGYKEKKDRYADLRRNCTNCRKRFSVTTGTYLHNTRLPLQTWLFAFAVVSDAKKGLSALQLQRNLGISYQTAFDMYHLIRDMMSEEKIDMLSGVTEADESFIGGKPRKPNIKAPLTEEGKEYLKTRTAEVKAEGFNLKKKKGNPAKVDLDTKRGRGSQKQVPLAGIVQRDGAVIAEVMESLGAKKLQALVQKHVDTAESLLITDQYRGYNGMHKFIEHIKIDHSKLYSYNGVNTNTIESFWAIVERGIMGQYHHVSLKYLPKYVVEFCFKFNNRNYDDMFETLVKAAMKVKVPNAILHDPSKPKPKSKKTTNKSNLKGQAAKSSATDFKVVRNKNKENLPF
jgi:transposase-like protein